MGQGGPTRAESVRTRGFVGGVLATAFAVAVGFGLIVPALPTFAVQLGAGYGAASIVIATFAAVRLVCSGPAGVAVDRLGSRWIVAAGLLIVSLSSGLVALAQTYPQLLVLRGAGGVGSALFIVGIGQHVVRTVPSRERGRANGMLQGAFLLGGASGPAIGGLVVEILGIRAPFVAYAATLLAAMLVTLRYLREEQGSDAVAASGRPAPPPDPSEGIDVPGPGVSGGAAGGRGEPVPPATAAHAPGPSPGASDGPPGAGTAATSDGTGAGDGRLGPLLRDPTFWAALYLYAAIAWASQGVRFVAVPLLGSDVLGEAIGIVGVALTVSSVAHGALLWPASRHADSRGRLGPLRVGTGVYVVSMLGLITVTGPVGLIAWMAVQGVANGIASPLPAAVVGDLAPPGAEGRAVGLMNVARDIGAVAGPLATGYIAEFWSFDAAFAVSAGLLGLGVLATFLMRETLER